MMDKRYVVAVAVLVTFANIMVFQQARIDKLKDYLEIAEMRADVNAEFTQELVWMRVNDVHRLTQDNLVAQGRIEGVVAYIKGDDEREMVSKLWHEGYTHGLQQVDYQEGSEEYQQVISDLNDN